ncbi:hypothetical protein VTN00DRAFT_7971 [Thermoascus crustaceus]|uniref:uncharacterized protein n=1 Tax=Thermoascus crustaceus TaxID=5088 RepID=UPI003744AF15
MTPRWWLYLQAIFWRFLMRIGMFVHDIAWPRPPRPSFTRSFTVLNHQASSSSLVTLHFYCPPGYFSNRALLPSPSHRPRKYPVVVNFHGGGFTLGRATDDARWARMVLDEVGAVVVSVDYRLAPEHPFPAAVDDGVDALRYLAAHADELALDVSQVVLTGFSAGGNLVVTVPLRWRERVHGMHGDKDHDHDHDHDHDSDASFDTDTDHRDKDRPDPNLSRSESTQYLLDQPPQQPLHTSQPPLRILAIFAWYPILDFVLPRSHRRATSPLPEKTLPSFLTTLFDDSYLPDSLDRSSPYASPVLAPDDLLRTCLPNDVFLYTCEWDMLLKEGQHFVRRLDGLGKRVRAMMIEKVPHAWDKSANPFRDQGRVNVLYRDACAEMRALLVEGTGGGLGQGEGEGEGEDLDRPDLGGFGCGG